MSEPQTTDRPAFLHRVEGEYREMPGLNLTLAQGARLWAVPRDEALDVLTRLVEQGVLRRNSVGAYVRA